MSQNIKRLIAENAALLREISELANIRIENETLKKRNHLLEKRIEELDSAAAGTYTAAVRQELPPTTCPICLQKFAKKSNMLSHQETAHNPNPPMHVCPHCVFKSKYKSSVSHHVKAVHNKIRNSDT